jgi:AcrR family transcriptional regulator
MTLNGTKTSREGRTKRTRERLLNEAFAILREAGEDAVTMASIAGRADVTERTVYRHFAAEPLQGWEQWALDIEDIVGVCETAQAVVLVQDRNRALLKP